MYVTQRLNFSVLVSVAAAFGLIGPLPVASAQSPRGNIATWSVQVNTPEWNKNLGVTGARQGCSSSPAVCVDNVRKVAQTSSVRATLVVPLNATTTAIDATQYSQLSLNAPFLQEVGIDDFVDQYTALSRVSPQPATVVDTVIANLKSANPALKFGGTIYDDQFTSAYLQDARLPAATRAQFDYVHLFVHFREDGLKFEQSVQQAKQLFPNALIIAGAYAYDRRAYLACTPGGAPCTTQQDLDLFSQTLTIQAHVLKRAALRDKALTAMRDLASGAQFIDQVSARHVSIVIGIRPDLVKSLISAELTAHAPACGCDARDAREAREAISVRRMAYRPSMPH